MHRLLLHHYLGSPFSEKVRALLGFKGLPWTGVTVPAILPKPDVVALTGGYRKTPFLQIGSDIYCDSALIADVLERLAPTPTLYPAESAGVARLLAQWADSTLFPASVGHLFQPSGVRELLGGLSPEQLKAFLADRAAMRGGAPSSIGQPEATAALGLYLRELEARLADGRPWLLGQAASLADFSVYHCLWFITRAKSVAGILEAHPRLMTWLGRVQAFSQGAADEVPSAEALALAARSPPAALPEGKPGDEPGDEPFLEVQGLARGARVTVSATDYGKDPVEGELVLSRPNEVAVRRTDARAGTVTVHFPRIGFQVRPVS